MVVHGPQKFPLRFRRLQFIAYFGIHCSVQVSDPSGGCAGRGMNSYGILRTPMDPVKFYPLAREQSLSFSGRVYWSESGLHRHLYTLNSIEISVRTRYQRNYVLLTGKGIR